MKKIFIKKSFSFFKKSLIFVCCFCFVFAMFSISSFAATVGDEELDLKLQSSNGTVFYFSEARFLNGQTGEIYRCDIDPIRQGSEHTGFRVNLDGYYDNNTRMLTFKVERSKNSSSYGRFHCTISTPGGRNETDLTYTLPKLNTTPSNNNAFSIGYFDTTDNNKQHIDFIGELPYEFYIVTWFDYDYSLGYMRTLYYDFEWLPSFAYSNDFDFDGYYDDEFAIISDFGDNLEFNAAIVDDNVDVTDIFRPLQFTTFVFDSFFNSLDSRQRVVVWVSLSLGVIAVAFSIGGAIASKIRR